MEPFMSKIQQNAIKQYINSNDIMLEYGSGGSTLLFCHYVSKYYSLEHEPDWYNKIKPQADEIEHLYYNLVKPNYGGENYNSSMDKGNDLATLFNTDVHGEWTISKDQYNKIKAQYPYAHEEQKSSIGRYWQYRDYVDYINKLNVKTFDKVLIDGRARTFCSYKVLPYLHKDSIVFIDDFYRYSFGNKHRGEVAMGSETTFFDLYEKIEQVDTMLIGRKK